MNIDIYKLGRGSPPPESYYFNKFSSSRSDSRRRNRLRIEFRDKKIDIINYSYIHMIRCDDNKILEIYYHNNLIYTIEGENLRELLEALHYEEVSTIREVIKISDIANDEEQEESKKEPLIINKITVRNAK